MYVILLVMLQHLGQKYTSNRDTHSQVTQMFLGL